MENRYKNKISFGRFWKEICILVRSFHMVFVQRFIFYGRMKVYKRIYKDEELTILKKHRKNFLWIAVVILTLCLLTSLFMKPDIEASGMDLFLYKMSGTSLFLIWMIGLLIELDVFHNKKNIPLVKSNHIGPHILFWAVLVITSFIAFGVFYSSTSTDFKLAMEQVDTSKTETNKATETISEVTETSLSADVKNEENTSAPESLPETESANEETDTSTVVSKLIENETYYFDDAVFTVNGIQLTVRSIMLHREYKPAGYSLEVAYSLRNQNATDATFEFSSQSRNDFTLEGQKARMTKQATHSNGHCTDYHLKANEETESLIGDFYALSSSAEKMINGESFEAVDISNAYTGQNLTIHFQVNGICNGQTETLTLSFDIDL